MQCDPRGPVLPANGLAVLPGTHRWVHAVRLLAWLPEPFSQLSICVQSCSMILSMCTNRAFNRVQFPFNQRSIRSDLGEYLTQTLSSRV
jgi:hypothetical protein